MPCLRPRDGFTTTCASSSRFLFPSFTATGLTTNYHSATRHRGFPGEIFVTLRAGGDTIFIDAKLMDLTFQQVACQPRTVVSRFRCELVLSTTILESSSSRNSKSRLFGNAISMEVFKSSSRVCEVVLSICRSYHVTVARLSGRIRRCND